MGKPTLIVATGNAGKMREIAAMVEEEHFPFVVKSLKDIYDPVPDIPETADTFEGNAFLKADWVFEKTGSWVLADDSGLEVDALDGAPGVWSARYAGEPANDPRNIAKLLDVMQSVPDEKRTARFRCTMALVGPNGIRRVVSGACEGRISHEAKGSNGFGYDPVFVPTGWSISFAEGESSTKNAISHRGRALAAIRAELATLFPAQTIR